MNIRARVLAVCFGLIVLGIGLQIWEHTRKGRNGHPSGKRTSRSSGDEPDRSLSELLPELSDSEHYTLLPDPSEKTKIELDLIPQPTLPPISGLNLPFDSSSGLPGLSQTIEGLEVPPVSPGTGAKLDGVKAPNDPLPDDPLPAAPLPTDSLTLPDGVRWQGVDHISEGHVCI